MIMSSLASVTLLAIVIALFALLIWIELRLSRSVHPWPGLILPGAALLTALAAVVLITASNPVGQGKAWVTVLNVLITFLFLNIPTIVFSCIYLRGRKHIRRTEELNRMRVQDL